MGRLGTWHRVIELEDLQTAINRAGTGGRIWVKSGSYTFSNNIVLGAGQRLHFDLSDGDKIDFASGYYFQGASNCVLTGYLPIEGVGSAANRLLFYLSSSVTAFDAENCLIQIKPTGNGLTAGSDGNILSSIVAGNNCRVNLRSPTSGISYAGGSQPSIFSTISGFRCFVRVEATSISDVTAGTRDLIAVALAPWFHYGTNNDVAVNINSVANTNGSEYGVRVYTNANYNRISGVITNCASGNFSNSGTANNYASLIY